MKNMKKWCLICFFFQKIIFCHGQQEYDSIRCYAIIDYIIENRSMIKSYMKEKDFRFLFNVKKIHMIRDNGGKVNRTREMEYQLREYYKGLEEDELRKALLNDYLVYFFEESPPNVEFLKGMNNYLDSILRKGKSVDTSKLYWSTSFSDSFFNYKSAIITYENPKQRNYKYWRNQLELVFLFDNEDRIKAVDFQLWIR